MTPPKFLNLDKDSTTEVNHPPELKRTIGVFGLACGVVNITVGTGIFVLPALVAENLGAAAIICYLVCGSLIFLIALCFAEVGSKIVDSGGTYTYIESAFGPFAGFLANNIFWLSCCLSDAAVANGLSKTLGYFYPALDSTLRPLVFFLLFGGLAWVNILGTKYGVKFMVITTFAKLIPLILLVAFGVSHIALDNFQWKTAFTFGDIGSATLILFFAFLGIENAVANSGEFRNPSRTVPLGILSGLSIVLLLYLAIQLTVQGVLGSELTLFKDAPLAEVSKRVFAYTGIVLITIAATVSMIGSVSAAVLAIPRVLFAGARDGIFPGFLQRVHSTFRTPYTSIIVYAGIDYFFAVFGAFRQLIILSTASVLLIYLGVVAATIKLRFKNVPGSVKTFKVAGGITVPLLALVTILWLLLTLSPPEVIGISIMLGVLTVIYLFVKLYKTQRKVPDA